MFWSNKKKNRVVVVDMNSESLDGKITRREVLALFAMIRETDINSLCIAGASSLQDIPEEIRHMFKEVIV